MKILTHNIVIAILCGTLASCDFLDFDETNSLKTKEDIYKYFGTTEQMLTHVYSFMPQDLGSIGGAMRECACDDAEFGAINGDVQVFNNGSWSPIKTVDTAWNLYKGIRAANGFIDEIEHVDFSRYEHNPSYANDMRKLKNFPYEARVLRAFYFFELARRYGDIPMPLTALDTDKANNITKTPFGEVVNFIVEECEEAAQYLPVTYRNEPGAQIGRITKGFAMALKTKALLYAASPLHNPTGDKTRWLSVAHAAYDLIQSGMYALDKAETANNNSSKEIVLMRMNAENSNFELYNFPLRFTEGNRPSNKLSHCTYPSQNLVDAFETVNGYSVKLTDAGWECDDPEFAPQTPYLNRDPRFYRAILANGMNFKDGVIETFVGGKDDKLVALGGTPTGYFLNKYIQPTTSFTPDHIVKAKHHWVIYRYAETLLSYAEAMINAFGDPNYSDNDFPHSALWALNQVRVNANMPEVDTSITPAEFLKKLYNEWRVEFAFEDHRFWDVRRWKIAPDTQRTLYGVRIEKVNSLVQFYRFVYENRTWKDCMYLYPIPQTELFNNPNLTPQNPNW